MPSTASEAVILGMTGGHLTMPADDVRYLGCCCRFWRAEIGSK